MPYPRQYFIILFYSMFVTLVTQKSFKSMVSLENRRRRWLAFRERIQIYNFWLYLRISGCDWRVGEGGGECGDGGVTMYVRQWSYIFTVNRTISANGFANNPSLKMGIQIRPVFIRLRFSLGGGGHFLDIFGCLVTRSIIKVFLQIGLQYNCFY